MEESMMEVRPKLGEKNYEKLIQYWFNSFQIHNLTGWPLVGNEGMKPYMVMMGIYSLIDYEWGQPEEGTLFSSTYPICSMGLEY